MAKDIIDKIGDALLKREKKQSKDIPNQIGANIPNQVGKDIPNHIPQEGMGGYGGSGDAARKRYTEKITNGEG